jgi:hypothetical protein
MTGIDEAVAEAKSTPLGEKIRCTKIAGKHGVVRSTLTRKVERDTRSHYEDAVTRQNLSLPRMTPQCPGRINARSPNATP